MHRVCRLRALALLAAGLAAPGSACASGAGGSLAVFATVRAFIPAEVTLTQARAIVVGPLPGGGVHTGAAADTPCLPLGNLPAGRYRLRALEGRISTFTARPRFLFPDPDDGYRVPGERKLDGFQLYRVLVPERAEFEVDVKPGARAVLGHIEVVRKPRSTWGVAVQRVPPAPDQMCQDSGSSAAGSGATARVRSAPERGT
jgi:hypothetical protein